MFFRNQFSLAFQQHAAQSVILYGKIFKLSSTVLVELFNPSRVITKHQEIV